MKIVKVKQTHKYSCSIACASMITGEKYDDLISEFGNNFHKQGLGDEIFLDYVSDKGEFICPMEWTDQQIRDSYTILKVVGLYRQS